MSTKLDALEIDDDLIVNGHMPDGHLLLVSIMDTDENRKVFWANKFINRNDAIAICKHLSQVFNLTSEELNGEVNA